tara:strand:- start:21609 stop:21818 length:210 start_codon:yes stop_codon:yes gene_type:complete
LRELATASWLWDFAGSNLLPTEVEPSITGYLVLKFSSKIRVWVDSNTKKTSQLTQTQKKQTRLLAKYVF